MDLKSDLQQLKLYLAALQALPNFCVNGEDRKDREIGAIVCEIAELEKLLAKVTDTDRT